MFPAVLLVVGYLSVLHNWRKKHASRNKREGTYANRRLKTKPKGNT